MDNSLEAVRYARNPYLTSKGKAPDQRSRWRAPQWEKGRQDRLNGEPCKSANGAYLEGWYGCD